MLEHRDGVVDLAREMTRRLERKAQPIGIEVRASGFAFALYGPDRKLFLHPKGVSHDVRWLTYGEASSALEQHFAGSGPDR